MSPLKRVLCPTLPKPGRSVELPEAEARHVIQVLRLKSGQKIEALDGQGHAAEVTLNFRQDRAFIEWVEPVQDSAEESASAPAGHSSQIAPLVLEQAVLKGEAMEWVVEKCVELGVKSLQPVLTAHTVVQMDRKGPQAFQERWQRIADQALKQCGRLERMKVELPIDLETLLVETADSGGFFCDESERADAPHFMTLLEGHSEPVRILIGPEGGWSESERQSIVRSKRKSAALGPLVLRAETAAIFAVSLAVARWQTGLKTAHY